MGILILVNVVKFSFSGLRSEHVLETTLVTLASMVLALSIIDSDKIGSLTLRVVKVRVSLRRELNILELTSLFAGVT
jgi:hypothetical protein